MTDLEAKVLIGGTAVVLALVGLLGKLIVHRRNNQQKTKPATELSKDLITYIDERATHKAAGAAAPVLLEVSSVRRELGEWKSETANRFDKVESKIDEAKEAFNEKIMSVVGTTGEIKENLASLRGELGYERRRREKE